MGPLMATAKLVIGNTRQAFRLSVLEALRLEVDGLMVPIEGGALDGVEVVSKGTLVEAIERIKYSKLPPIDVTSAEVKTPAEVYVDAVCPRCRLTGRILANISSELLVTTTHSELRLKAKAKAHTHICGQLALATDDGNGQTEFGLEDIVGPDDALTDEERDDVGIPPDGISATSDVEEGPDALPGPDTDVEPVNEAEARHERLLHDLPTPAPLTCKGSNHVPGHSPDCPESPDYDPDLLPF